MKKLVFLVFVFVLCFSAICFATEVEDATDSIMLDNYDDFYSAQSTGITQGEIKDYYREFLAYSRDEETKNQPEKQYKAKIVDVNKASIVYDLSYYTPYQINVQKMKVEILEGEYKGKVIEGQYLLTADTYGNLKLTEASIGNIIYVSIDKNEEGTLKAYTTSYDTRIQKFPIALVFVIITAVLMVAVGRLEGFKTLLIIALIFDLVFVITIPEMMKYNEVKTLTSSDKGFPTTDEIDADTSSSILEKDDNGVPTKVEIVVKNNSLAWLIVIDTLVICFAILVNKMGLTKEMLHAFAVSVTVIIFAALVLSGINTIMKMNGNTLEAVSLAENIINRNIDFGALYMLTTLLIASVVVPNTVSKIVKHRCHNIAKCINSQILLICVVSFTFIIPKVMAMIIYRYDVRELINSEILILEFVRIIVLSLAILAVAGISKYVVERKKAESEEEAKNEFEK